MLMQCTWMGDLGLNLHYPAACVGSWRWESVGVSPVITQAKHNMEWIYELAANLFGLSHDWAVLLVQLAIVLGGILLLIFLLPWLGARFKIEVYPQGCDQRQRSRSYVPYWQLWGQPGLFDAGVDYILEICMNHNLRRQV